MKQILKTKNHHHFWIILLLVIPFSLPAQMKTPVKLGLKISPNLTWMNTNVNGYSSNGVRAGATVGFVCDIYFAERYALSTGFDFNFLGGKLKYDNKMITQGDTLTGTMSRQYSLIYLEIPLLIKMQTKKFGRFSFYGQIGFGTGFRLTATAKDDFVSDKGKEFSEKNNVNDETTLIRESVIIGVGTEFYLDQSTRFFFGLAYSNSLNNVLTGYNKITGANEKAWLNYAQLNIGILF